MPGLDPRKNTTISAYLGLVTTVLEEARKAPRLVVKLQVQALTTVLGAGGRALSEYGHLAERGEQLVARLRGGGSAPTTSNGSAASGGSAPAVNGSAFDSAAELPVDLAVEAPVDLAVEVSFDLAVETPEDAAVAAPEQSPLDGVGMSAAAEALSGLSADDIEVMAEVVAETIAADLQDDVTIIGDSAQDPDVAASDPLVAGGYSVDDGLDVPPTPRTAPAGAAAPSPEPDTTADEPAPVVALPVVPEAVPEAAAQPGAALTHDQLPLADYDHMTLGGLRGRLRVLDLTSLQQLLDYERAHADRLSITTMLSNRIAKVQAQGTPAGPSERVSVPAGAPDAPRSSQTGSRVGPATRGPKQNPPSQGVPTNPAQPR